MKIQVGVISHKQGPMLERCLNSLIKVTAGIDYELILQLEKGTHSDNWNRLFSRFDADFICILEDDAAAIMPNWLKGLIEIMVSQPEIGIVMPIESKDGVRADPGFLRWMNAVTNINELYGFCNVIRKGVDIICDDHVVYFADQDLGLQAMKKGWKLAAYGHTMILHGDADSGRISNKPDEERQKADAAYFQKKWDLA